MQRLTWRQSGLVVAGVAALPATFVLYQFNPSQFSFFPKCVLYQCTGLYCPGCGATRALHQLLHGNLSMALRYNGLLVIALPYLVYGLMELVRTVLNPKAERMPRAHPAVIWMVFGVVVGFGILRNIPAYPFSLLAPPA